jgi:NAD(P)H-nitrite reductase large subunit
MPQAIVDPEELRRFARNLKKFNVEMQDRITVLGAQLAGLGKTWRDQEHKKFAEEFEHHMKVISRFIDVTEEHIPYLLRKAELIEQYLEQR